MSDDLDRELLEAEALASDCDSPEAWDAKIAELASQKPAQIEPLPERCAFCACVPVMRLHGFAVCAFHRDNGENSGLCSVCMRRDLISKPAYIENGHKHEVLASRAPSVADAVIDESKPTMISATLRDDEAGTIDDEYLETFNGTINEVKDLEPEQLQALRHRLDRMIRRAKIQHRAIRMTEDGKVAMIDEKRRKAIREKDTEFMAKRKASEGDATKTPREKKASSSTGLSAAEKQVKQFVKLNMDEATIRTTLSAVGTAIPENLAELIAKHRK